MRVTLVLALALALAVLPGCVQPPPAPAGNNSTTPSDGMTNMTAKAMTVTVAGGLCPPTPPPVPSLYSMAPTKLTLKLNERVNLTLKNDGCGPHDLVIEGIDGAKIGNVAAGKTGSVEFTPTKAGSYKMYCTIGGGTPASHKDNGMSGDVTVA